MKTKQHAWAIGLIIIILLVVSFIGISQKNKIAGLFTKPETANVSVQKEKSPVVPEIQELDFLKPQIESVSQNQKLIYSKEIPNEQAREIVVQTPNPEKKVEVRADKASKQKIFLSPNGKYLAVTVGLNEEYTVTYITDAEGRVIVPPHDGSFSSWSPDSRKVSVFLSGFEEGVDGRRIYYLDIDGDYENSGLPLEVISADISPINKSTIYSLTKTGTDDSSIHLLQGRGDEILIGEGRHTFVWLRWSPNGEQVAFMRYSTKEPSKFGKQSLWIMNKDGSSQKEISAIQWNYPPVWSKDGSKILFANQGDIWEYYLSQDRLEKITIRTREFVQHPTYSTGGSAIVFSDGQQIWSLKNGIETQLTTGVEEKGYPILIQNNE